MSSSQRTAVLKAIPGAVHPIVGHTLTCLTDGNPVVTHNNGIRYALLPAAVQIEINERIYLPDVFTQTISRHVVMSRIKTDVQEG